MKFRLIAAQRGRFSVRIMCDVMGVSPAGYYAWHGRPESPRKAANRVLLTEIRRVHTAHRGRYGAPRIHAALRAGGYMASRGRVARLMHHHGIQAITPRRATRCNSPSRSLAWAGMWAIRGYREAPSREEMMGVSSPETPVYLGVEPKATVLVSLSSGFFCRRFHTGGEAC
jgi:transposase InsO family protein